MKKNMRQNASLKHRPLSVQQWPSRTHVCVTETRHRLRHGPEIPVSGHRDGVSFHSDSGVLAEEQRARRVAGAAAGSQETMQGQLSSRPPSPQRSWGSGPHSEAQDWPPPITWELVRKGGCSAPTPDLLNRILGAGPSVCMLTSSPVDSDNHPAGRRPQKKRDGCTRLSAVWGAAVLTK